MELLVDICNTIFGGTVSYVSRHRTLFLFLHAMIRALRSSECHNHQLWGRKSIQWCMNLGRVTKGYKTAYLVLHTDSVGKWVIMVRILHYSLSPFTHLYFFSFLIPLPPLLSLPSPHPPSLMEDCQDGGRRGWNSIIGILKLTKPTSSSLALCQGLTQLSWSFSNH